MSETPETARAVVVYESMFGSTRLIAEAIADGLRESADVRVLPVREAPESFPDCDLIVLGAPTHAHGMSRPATRAEAGRWADDRRRALTLEPDAEGIGVREWLESCGDLPDLYAAFDTRADMTELFTGSAAAILERRLHKTGARKLADRASFVVDKQSALARGEIARARDWGRAVGEALHSQTAVRR
ncbi:flavodoxin [Leifsonia sp. LS1]|uniref:flavodoxin family protein n=1 Tax=Leifsonia sp. LS1 TaxID=2828483 RepID=UPI001CFC4BC8|nr:flavodoxin domain-containing protein [Leifsonia sp. LS1]GIT81769.1 flavodoxin [Leifsonia sp. LS1]